MTQQDIHGVGEELRRRRYTDYNDVRFSDDEYERRYKKAREEMYYRDLDCLVIYGCSAHTDSLQANIRYLSGYIDEIQSYVVVPYDGEPTLFADLYPQIPDAFLMSYIDDVRWGTTNRGNAIVNRIRELGYEDRNIGFVGSPGPSQTAELPANDYLDITKALPEAEFKFVSDLMDKIRLKKSDEEIEAIREGARLCNTALEALQDAIEPGVTERELKKAIMESYVAEGEYFFQLLGSTSMENPDMPYPWEHQSGRIIREGDIVIVELSARNVQGYAGQILKTFVVGEEPNEHYRELHNVAEQLFHEILTVLEPGATTEDIVEVATPLIEDRGWTIHAPLVHGWGGLGIQHPLIGTQNEGGYPNAPFEFEEGHTVVIEPNPVAPDQMSGVFLGEYVLITEDGAERLHNYPIELTRVD